MTETADKSKDPRACGDIAKVFEPSETVSILGPVVEGSEVSEVSEALLHLDSEIHAIFGDKEAPDEPVLERPGMESGEPLPNDAGEKAAGKTVSEVPLPELDEMNDDAEMTASQEVRAIMRSVSSAVDMESQELLRDNSSELPENPEVSARLTNLSLRHAGTRPAWFDFEPLALPGRTRQCRQVYWRIATDHAANRKCMMVLLAPSGMGKTAFLSELYAMLEHAPHDVLTLAPGAPGKKPFQALKNILEQRFYISGDASFERISQFVAGAVKGIMRSCSDEVSQEVTAGILSLWRPANVAESKENGLKCKQDVSGCSSENLLDSEKTWAGKSDEMPKRRSVHEMKPPALATQVTSMQAVIDAYQKTVQEQNSLQNQETHASTVRIQTIPKPVRQNSVPPIAAFKSGKEHGDNLPIVLEVPAEVTETEEVVQVLASDAYTLDVSSDVSVCAVENDVAECQDIQAEAVCDAQVADDAEYTGDKAHEALDVSQEEKDARALCELYDGMSMDTARQVIRLETPLIRLLEADLKKNAQVLILDDAERFDIASLVVISRVFEGIGDVPLSIVMTSGNMASLPVCMHCCDLEEVRLRSLSDSELARLTRHILKKLSASREKMIVPQDMCLLIAQRSFGSPKRVQELTLRHFTPDTMIHWNDAMERLRREPLPRELAIELVRRIRECSITSRALLQFASYLNAPFTASTIECILAGWEERASLGEVDCHKILKILRAEGYLERAEDGIGRNTPTYVFKHECERLVIAGTTPKPMRHHVYGAAAQWYALNNAGENYDESIGDLWRSHRSYHEACRYYERAAYRARRQAQLQKAWRLFRKLLKTLPSECIAQRIQYSLDGAAIAFRLGHIDEAFRLCRLSSHHALKISAYNQAARAHVLMASMLIEIGSVRHVLRYTARANSLLNCEGDAWTRCHLYNVMTRRALMMGQHKEALKWHKKALDGVKNLQLLPQDRLLLDWTSAEVEANYGCPIKALEMLARIADETSILGCSRLQALIYCSQGHLYARLNDIDKALEALNIALGMAQEMNDVILHANLLSDIAEAALALEARRTARSTTEICLGMAQQTHQKSLIARCLTNTACLQISGGLYDKAMRTLRKAHKIAVALRCVTMWTRILGLFAQLYAMPDNPQYNPSRANQIYRRLMGVYEHYNMPLERAQMMPQFAEFLLRTHQNMAALNTYRTARGIYISLGLEQAADKMQSRIDRIMKDNKFENT